MKQRFLNQKLGKRVSRKMQLDRVKLSAARKEKQSPPAPPVKKG